MKFRKKLENTMHMASTRKKMRGRHRSRREDKCEGKIRIYFNYLTG